MVRTLVIKLHFNCFASACECNLIGIGNASRKKSDELHSLKWSEMTRSDGGCWMQPLVGGEEWNDARWHDLMVVGWLRGSFPHILTSVSTSSQCCIGIGCQVASGVHPTLMQRNECNTMNTILEWIHHIVSAYFGNFISSDRSSCTDDDLWYVPLFQIFTQSIDAIDVTSVTLSRLNSINAIDVTRCWEYLGDIFGVSWGYL